MVQETSNKPLVEICEAKELLHIPLVLWHGPGGNPGDLDRIHLNMIMGDDHAEVLD